ncbi:hypothetical protein AYR66_14755 [Noviherbaspirillum denitrificans]|uniref:Uncharacterized protein n=2 Tax=Noviherbaspirillum denitrificans TaxID=1968433 RepID=A0A254TGY9_9BURK|nr:hypothetical protein AYR66_14755 [Noviherbaspirillum denitrificans]
MDTAPDFELIKDAYAIIDGIPETAIDLDQLVSARGETLEHGTVCSPAGWLAQHPAFNAAGLTLSDDDSRLQLSGEEPRDPAAILAQVFRLQPMDARHLFADRMTYTLGDDSGLSDKRLWLREVREFLKQHGQLDADFEEHLETRGPFAEPANPAEIRAI